MRRQKGFARFRDFCKGFFVTLAVLVPLYAGVLLWQSDRLARDAAPSAADPFARVPVSPAKSYNLLFLVRDEVAGRLLSAQLVRFDTATGRVVVCDLPNTAILLEAKRPRTLSAVLAEKGTLGAVAALNETLGVTLSGFVAMDTDALAALIDALGEFSFTLERPLEVRDSEWLVTYAKPAGTSWFSGNDAAQLLLYGNYEEADAAALRKKLWEAALRQYAGADFSAALADAYTALVNRFDTDVSVSGLYSLTLAADACAGGDFTVRLTDGVYANDRFEFSSAAADELRRLFGGTPPDS